jgi:predicted fused transcriptional regulator/phosphomethylpyrimidine kinase
MSVNHANSHEHVARDHERGETGEEAKEEQNASEEFGQSRYVAQPIRQAKGGDVVAVTIESRKYTAAMESVVRDHLVVSVIDHGATQDEAQKESTPWLEAVE